MFSHRGQSTSMHMPQSTPMHMLQRIRLALRWPHDSCHRVCCPAEGLGCRALGGARALICLGRPVAVVARNTLPRPARWPLHDRDIYIYMYR